MCGVSKVHVVMIVPLGFVWYGCERHCPRRVQLPLRRCAGSLPLVHRSAAQGNGGCLSGKYMNLQYSALCHGFEDLMVPENSKGDPSPKLQAL